MGKENFSIGEDEKEACFGPLYPFIADDAVTDIDFNGREVWLTNCRNERFMADTRLSEDFVDQFTKRIANAVSKPFHKMEPVLEAETDTLRITIVHESVCQGVRTFCIRKSLPSVRLTDRTAVSERYATPEMLALLKNCVRAHMNLVFTGNPGAGKTECAKFFSQFIPGRERVITIEDNPEWHYSSVNPGKDCIELKISPSMDYTRAIKTCLRLNPTWMFLSEARSVEVRYLIEGFSTGVKGITTLHTDDVRKIPDRIVNMAGSDVSARLENDVYAFIDVGILIRRKEEKRPDGHTFMRRFIDQICFFSRDEGVNSVFLAAEGGEIRDRHFPDSVMRRFHEAGIEDPFDWRELTPQGGSGHIMEFPDFEKQGGTYLGRKTDVG